MKVLISSSVKEGIEGPAKQLADMGCEILATKGTAEYLEQRGVEVRRLSEITGISETPELKTLHPKVFEMIFSGEVGLVAVTPYNFDGRRESIDVGGIALLRAAAKAGVPAAFSLDGLKKLIEQMEKGGIDLKENSREVFRFTSEYDRRIAEMLR